MDENIYNWLNKKKLNTHVEIEQIKFSELKEWGFNNRTGNLEHFSKKFFSVIGLDIKTNWGEIYNWQQPIIKQSEIGILGIITKRFDQKLYYLMQAKIEPGNINHVQISPTLQATKSNYLQVHNGKKPKYLGYFFDNSKKLVIDQLQSEQGARFYKKRNRNIIIEIKDDIEIGDDFRWMTLDQIVQLLNIDNCVNMDTRTVISSLLFRSNTKKDNSKPLNSFNRIVQWMTNLKTKYELNVKRVNLNKVSQWIKTDEKIYHKNHKYFEIIPIKVIIEGRELKSWTQPMIKSKQEGICAFILKRINCTTHVLVQGKIECGNFDIIEMAPTVQCLTDNYLGDSSKELPYLKYVLEAKKSEIIYDVFQSEEGGRFFKEQNRNLLISVDDSFDNNTPENYIWMTLPQIQKFLMFNNFFNIQARSLISSLVTKENEFN